MPLNSTRRRKLSDILPEGVVTVPSWLMENGFTRDAIDNLVKSEALVALKRGVYVRGKTVVSWQSLVYTCQSLLKTDLVVGGLTALELLGYSHYLTLSEKRNIHLYGTDKLPSWMNGLLPGITFTWHHERELMGRRKKTDLRPTKSPHHILLKREWREGFPELKVSTAERAYLEVLTQVPEKVSFEHADQLMQGLTSLSPNQLQLLLENIHNVKVTRLFFWFADRHNYSWLQKLDKTRIDFGNGNRMLVKGGKLDKKYNISVPEFL